jgi:hypothetical protein
MRKWARSIGLLLLGALAAIAQDLARDALEVVRTRCVACHGPNQQMGGLRFDQRASVQAKAGNLVAIITSGLNGRVMPPSGPRLTAQQVARIKEWVDAGLPWSDGPAVAPAPAHGHWSFRPIARPPVPEVRNTDRIRNPIDKFVLARLERDGFSPAPQAGELALIRRISLDLTGLPPHPGEALDGLVDRLLTSPHFGEKWARHWLDLARYADSDGYEQDGVRPHAWRYRDWVIRALNRNMPFDQFTIEQIAGDLLPNATLEQRTATGFQRNTLTSREGGIDVEQIRAEQVGDRAETVANTWLGLTFTCARCHDHKYDPITTRDYYSLYAFFNSAEEVNHDDPAPGELGPYLRRLPEYSKKVAALRAKYRVDELEPLWEAEVLRAMKDPQERLEWTQVLDYVRVYVDHGHDILRTPPEQRTPKQAHAMMRVFLKYPGPLTAMTDAKGISFGTGFQALEELDTAYPALSEIPALAEMASAPKTHVHVRGDFRNQGFEVQPDTPAILPAMTGPRNRLGLASWLVSPSNPLTARVAVNRIWQELFGAGLVTTSEDFGTRGDAPVHTELLDWLAAEFIESGWDLKHMIRLMVESATYRQSSAIRPELYAKDPANRLLARQNRFRLPAELIRDAALTASGLLNPVIGGRSVRPPMPEAMTKVAYRMRWPESEGADRYRRGLYIFFQRSVPYPQLMAFDAPASLVSCSRRERSTTPIQALNLLNDPVFVEAAEALAFRIRREAPGNASEKIRHAFQLCLNRAPRPEEVDELSLWVEKAKARGSDPWTGIATILLNLDEFLTRE